MKAFLLSFFVAATLLLTACGSKQTEALNKESLAKVHEGMSMDEVKAILGDPSETKTGSIPAPPGITASGTTYVYHNGDNILSVSFVDGKVAIMGTNMQ